MTTNVNWIAVARYAGTAAVTALAVVYTFYPHAAVIPVCIAVLAALGFHVVPVSGQMANSLTKTGTVTQLTASTVQTMPAPVIGLPRIDVPPPGDDAMSVEPVNSATNPPEGGDAA